MEERKRAEETNVNSLLHPTIFPQKRHRRN